jgi:hypothetical protein
MMLSIALMCCLVPHASVDIAVIAQSPVHVRELKMPVGTWRFEFASAATRGLSAVPAEVVALRKPDRSNLMVSTLEIANRADKPLVGVAFEFVIESAGEPGATCRRGITNVVEIETIASGAVGTLEFPIYRMTRMLVRVARECGSGAPNVVRLLPVQAQFADGTTTSLDAK